MLNERGKIYNRGRSKQSYDFSGLRFGTITPTDLDCLIEYHGKAYVIVELKYGDNVVPLGQRIALERLTDDLERSGKQTITMIAAHNISDIERDIDVSQAVVREIRWKEQWWDKIPKYTTRIWIQKFLDCIREERVFIFECYSTQTKIFGGEFV